MSGELSKKGRVYGELSGTKQKITISGLVQSGGMRARWQHCTTPKSHPGDRRGAERRKQRVSKGNLKDAMQESKTKIPAFVSGCPDAQMIASAFAAMRMDFIEQQKRGHAKHGPYLTNMYQKVLHVATGSGICVFHSFLLQQSKTDVHIIWIAKKIQDNYGDGIWEAINDAPPEKITMIDTFVSGRPKTRELVVNKAKEWGAEVVIVTSNPIGRNEIVNGCKAIGIPAFGPIWDS
ncbi:unnamed protein product [Calypogeia fissa]